MNAQIWTYRQDELVEVRNIVIPDNYDGNAYGDTLDFVVGSNQAIVTDKDDFRPEMIFKKDQEKVQLTKEPDQPGN